VPGVFPTEGDEGRVQDPVPPVPEPWPKVSGGGNNSGSVTPDCGRRRQPHLATVHRLFPRRESANPAETICGPWPRA